MPFRSDIEIDAVEYSDRPKEEGPAPNREFIERGEIIDGAVRGSSEVWDAEFQFWLKIRGHPDNEFTERCAAGYFAWEIGDQSGRYGVFDGYESRLWFGAEPYVHGDTQYFYIDIGDNWRNKIHWNEFVDRVYMYHLQYPAEDQSGLLPVPREDLVQGVNVAEKTDVYKVETSVHNDEIEYYVQLWRPENSQAVFFATTSEYDDRRYGKWGVLEQKAIMADTGFAITLQDETLSNIRSTVDALRENDIQGVELLTAEKSANE